MLNNDDILDAPQQSEKKPPANPKIEKRVYLGIIFLQYFLILVGVAKMNERGADIVAIVWWIGAFFFHLFIHILQFFSNIKGFAKSKNPKRLVHFILIIVCLLLGFLNIYNWRGGVFLIIIPHALAWFYIYILHTEQKEREQ